MNLLRLLEPVMKHETSFIEKLEDRPSSKFHAAMGAFIFSPILHFEMKATLNPIWENAGWLVLSVT